jgi:hypothetical protein
MNACQYLNKESLLLVFVLVFLSSVYTGCSSTPPSSAELDLDGNWQLHHLEGTKITVLEPDEEGLFVGTEAGLFQLQGTELVPLGLEEHEIVGVVRLKNGELLASVREWVFGSGNPTLFKTVNKETWKPFINNFGGEEGKYTLIERGPIAPYHKSDTLFVRGSGGNIILFANGGQNWDVVGGRWDSWGGGSSPLLHIDPYHEGRIWTGGISILSEVLLWKIYDYRKSWDEWVDVRKGLSDNVEAMAYTVTTHPINRGKVLVGLSWAARKSTDGGQSWRTSLEKTGVRAFARSLQHPNVIYAGGRISSGKLYFAATVDFEETWQKEIFEEGPYPITTNDLAVQVIDGQEVLFLGTDRGLYSFELN